MPLLIVQTIPKLRTNFHYPGSPLMWQGVTGKCFIIKWLNQCVMNGSKKCEVCGEI